jgi:hypothetical protein
MLVAVMEIDVYGVSGQTRGRYVVKIKRRDQRDVEVPGISFGTNTKAFRCVGSLLLIG